MASIIVGSVAVDVVPNATNFARDLRAQIEGPVDAVGQEIGQNLSDAVVDHLAGAIPEGLASGEPEAADAGDSAGAKYADAFSGQIRSKIDAALKALPEAKVNADTSEAEAKLDDLRDQLIELGMNELDISVTDDEALAKLADIRTQLEQLSLDSPDIRVRVDAAQAETQLAALLAQIYELDAANQALAASMAADIEAEHALGELMNLDVDAEHALAASMAADWEATTESIAGSSGALPAVSALGVALGLLAVIGPPVIGVLGAGFGALYIGIKNAHVETTGLDAAWQDLEAEAGKAIEPGLQVAVNDLTASLPKLNPLIQVLDSDIGNALADVGKWLGNGGTTEIVNYLTTEIPIVGHLFESAGAAAGEFFTLMQGPANKLMGTISDILDALAKVENFGGQYVSGANTAKGASLPGSTIGQVGYATSSSGGYAPEHAQTTGDYFAGIAHDVTKFLSDGASPPKSTPKAPPLTASLQPVPLSVMQHGTQTPEGQGPTLNAEQLQQATSGLDANTVSLTKNAAAAGETVNAYMNAQTTAAQFAAQTLIDTQNMQAENDAAGLLSQALQSIGGDTLGVAQANTQFHASITALNTALKTNGDSLNINTNAGQLNQAAIEASVNAARAHMTAIAQQTGSTEQATAAYNADIATLKQQLTATGASKQAIDNYVDSIDKIKPIAKTQIDLDDDAAVAAIAGLKAQLAAIANPKIGITVTSEAALRAAANSANGNFFEAYADGAHVAQMAPAGAMRVWAEPETGGESYVPHAISKRARSTAIMAETAKLFGDTYIPRDAQYASDGLVLRGSVDAGLGSAPGGHGHSHPINVLLDGKKITKVVNEQNGWNSRS